MPPSDKIKRSFVWLRKTLGIIDKTTLPGEVLGDVRPVIDLFGWDRLGEASVVSANSVVAPGATVNGDVTPDGVLRLVLHANVQHTDTNVDHFLWIDKLAQAAGGFIVGVTSPNVAVPVLVDQSTSGWFVLAPGDRIRGNADVALVAGALTLNTNFIDLPLGEYIPSI